MRWEAAIRSRSRTRPLTTSGLRTLSAANGLTANQENVDVLEPRARPLLILGDCARVNRFTRLGVGHVAQGLVEDSITDLQAHPRVAHHIAVPAALVWKHPALVVGREQVEVALIDRAVRGNGMWNQVGRARLNEDLRMIFGERPIGNGLGNPVPSQPQSGALIAGFVAEKAQ